MTTISYNLERYSPYLVAPAIVETAAYFGVSKLYTIPATMALAALIGRNNSWITEDSNLLLEKLYQKIPGWMNGCPQNPQIQMIERTAVVMTAVQLALDMYNGNLSTCAYKTVANAYTILLGVSALEASFRNVPKISHTDIRNISDDPTPAPKAPQTSPSIHSKGD